MAPSSNPHQLPRCLTLGQAMKMGLAMGVDRFDVQLLLLHALGQETSGRAWLLAHDDDTLAPDLVAMYTAHLKRRALGEPLAYITGAKEFFGLRLQVDARVLVPRPDTETLVDWALELPQESHACVLDLGTGSGAIALALKHSRPNWEVHALDASADALAVARANAQQLGLDIRFHQGSWLSAPAPDEPTSRRWSLIASNPPYIEIDDPHLVALTHEPRQALVAGADGLADLRTIISQAPRYLKLGGWLILEHGYNQAPAVRELLKQAGFGEVQTRQDLGGVARCSGGQWLDPL